MKHFSFLASRLYNVPLFIAPAKLQVILWALKDRVGLNSNLVVFEGEPPVEMFAAKKEPSQSQETRIAVVDMFGSLVHRASGLDADSGVASYETIGNAVSAAAHDPRVNGILLRIDSPGGEAAGAFELAKTVRDAASMKPVWSVVDGMALSAGYLIASQTNRILLGSNASTGSVGIIMIHLDQSESDQKEGLKFTVLKRGLHKDDFNPHAPLSEGAIAEADRILDHDFNLFVDHVANGRKLEAKKVRALEAGIFFDEEALGLGLADGKASYREALAEMHSTIASPSLHANQKGVLMADNPLLLKANAEGVLLFAPDGMKAPPVPAGPSASDYEEIASLCRIAKVPHMAADFIAARQTVAEVKRQLEALALKQDEETEIFSPITASAKTMIEEKPKQSLADLMAARFRKRGAA